MIIVFKRTSKSSKWVYLDHVEDDAGNPIPLVKAVEVLIDSPCQLMALGSMHRWQQKGQRLTKEEFDAGTVEETDVVYFRVED